MDSELKKTGYFDGWLIQPIQDKFGISVFHIVKNNESYVGKYYSDEQIHGRREINHYTMLNEIGVPTLNVVAHTDCLLLLEDISASDLYRLGTEDDMSEIRVAHLVGKWVNLLHVKGRNYKGLLDLPLLDNINNELDIEKIYNAIQKSGTEDNPFWSALIENIENIKRNYLQLCNTVTYNDFWWDNLAVSKNYTSVIPFDYNCVYRKYAYADIRHILSVLSDEAGTAFLEAYGDYDENEKAFEDLYWSSTGIIAALNMDELPSWADKFVEMLNNGMLMKYIIAFEKQKPKIRPCIGDKP